LRVNYLKLIKNILVSLAGETAKGQILRCLQRNGQRTEVRCDAANVRQECDGLKMQGDVTLTHRQFLSNSTANKNWANSPAS